MSYSVSADITIFGQAVNITPNPEFPTRIESRDGFKVKGSDINTLKQNFPISLPDGLSVPSDSELDLSDIVLDTKTEEFQVGIGMTPGSTFFLNQFPSVFTLEKVNLFLSYGTPPDWAASATYAAGDTVTDTTDSNIYENITGTNGSSAPSADTANWKKVG